MYRLSFSQRREMICRPSLEIGLMKWRWPAKYCVSCRHLRFQSLSDTTTMPPVKPAKSRKRHVPNPPDGAQEMISAIASLVSISLVLFIYQRALVPIYATGPTTYALNPVIAVAVLLAALNPTTISTSRNWLYTALGLAAAPNATYWVSVLTSRKHDPFWGPVVTHVIVLVPLVFFLTTSVIEAQVSAETS